MGLARCCSRFCGVISWPWSCGWALSHPPGSSAVSLKDPAWAENFKIAIDIINFSLASNHPLYISLYDEYASEFEPELLKKSSLLASIKGLGEFHPQTTKLYGKYYHEGTAAY